MIETKRKYLIFNDLISNKYCYLLYSSHALKGLKNILFIVKTNKTKTFNFFSLFIIANEQCEK